MKRWIVTLMSAVGVLASSAICMGDEDARDKGLFSQGSFLSEAISSVTDKLGKISSGEEKIVAKDAKGVDKNILEYDADTLGRSRASLNADSYREYRKKIKQDRNE